MVESGIIRVRPDDHWSEPNGPEPEWRPAHEHERTAALVIAAERIPEVRSLLPTRPANALTCVRCSGYFIETITCPDCGALGWIPPAAT